MAIDLKSLSRPTSGRPMVATLFSEPGLGKTTLAAMFPRPVFIRTEDGTASLDGHPEAMLFPVARSTADVFDAIEALATQADIDFDSLSGTSATVQIEGSEGARHFNGIVLQAVLATASVFFVMLVMYRTRIIKVTDKFRRAVIFATKWGR